MENGRETKRQLDVERLGQVFTPDFVVDAMLGMRRNTGKVLEPSCGDGAFFNRIPGCVGIEYDSGVCPEGAINMDFFDYDIDNRFDTIIGNPPYVKFQQMDRATRKKLDMTLFDNRSNLYLFFIYKCIRHLNNRGELIFIVPRDFMKATSSRKLNGYIFDTGTITDFIDLGDSRVFKGACPNCVIFRYEKGNFDRTLSDGSRFSVRDGQIYIGKDGMSGGHRLSELFSVKVGAVSGADDIFTSPNGNREFVNSRTCRTGELRRMIYNVESEELLPYKDRLLSRKIKSFDGTNWYTWGRNHFESESPRVYVNSKTRNTRPFFHNECRNYDGSVMALFPVRDTTEEKCREVCDALNDIDWKSLGFVCDGRYIFTQRSLENCIIGDDAYDRMKSILY